MKTSRHLALGVVALGLLLGAGIASGEPAAASVAVTIDNFTFAPATITVRPGTTVTWTNKDDMPHTVVATDKSFASRALDTGEAFSFTFDKPGAFDYFCSIHPRMTGRVVVKPDAAAGQ